MSLVALGWNNILQEAYDNISETNLIPARVFSVDRSMYQLMTEDGELSGTITGNFRHRVQESGDFPAVGDWVLIAVNSNEGTASIHALLPRHSKFSRKVTGTIIQEQVIAANIDTVFIVSGLDDDFNLRRIERYLSLTWNSGAQPVIILNKADQISDEEKLASIIKETEAVALGVPVYAISATTAFGTIDLAPYFSTGKTVAFLGSSGVGKSTLLNLILGRTEQKTAAIREDDSKGRHTTTRRQLFMLPSGGMIIDTPGMRELQLWMSESDFAGSFSDIEEFAVNCRFNDCTHNNEPGCAVKAAIELGALLPERLTSYCKMLRELKYLDQRQQETSWQTHQADRKFGKMCRDVMKEKNKSKQ